MTRSLIRPCPPQRIHRSQLGLRGGQPVSDKLRHHVLRPQCIVEDWALIGRSDMLLSELTEFILG